MIQFCCTEARFVLHLCTCLTSAKQHFPFLQLINPRVETHFIIFKKQRILDYTLPVGGISHSTLDYPLLGCIVTVAPFAQPWGRDVELVLPPQGGLNVCQAETVTVNTVSMMNLPGAKLLRCRHFLNVSRTVLVHNQQTGLISKSV